MSKEDFDKMVSKLVNAGHNIIDSQYSEENFGNWCIKVETIPNRRIVWDGRDSMLSVEEETEEEFNGMTVWKDIYVSEKIEKKEILDIVDAII